MPGGAARRLILFLLFFTSGCAALIYQVAWQRMLFALFGVDLESITIIVSAFMFGLGLGGLLGGVLADAIATRLLALYAGIEFGIACLGFLSPRVIPLVGAVAAHGGRWTTALASFLILVLPTCLMGATFPILVAHVNQSDRNIGKSVGALYFANTLGGAWGAWLAGFAFFATVDLTHSIFRAAFLNLAIGGGALLAFRSRTR